MLTKFDEVRQLESQSPPKNCFGCKYEPTWMPYNGSVDAGFCKYPLPVYIKASRILKLRNKLYYQKTGYRFGHNDLWQAGGGATTEKVNFSSCKAFVRLEG